MEALQAPGVPTLPAGAPAQHPANTNGFVASSSSSWLTSSAYFLPTSADRFVIAFRKWLQRHAGAWYMLRSPLSPAVAQPLHAGGPTHDWTPLHASASAAPVEPKW